MKRALGLAFALSAVSCGDSEPFGDPFHGFIDASGLDSKFRITGRCGSADCFLTQTATVNGDPVVFYNLGLVANPNSDKTKPPAPISAESVTTTVYDFPAGCIAGQPYDRRTDTYSEETQYPVFSKLPLANTSTSAPPVLPLVKVVSYTGSEKYTCNAIKNATSVDEGAFLLTQQEETHVALRAVIPPVEVRLKDGTQYAAPLGWYKGMLLNYFDAGTLPLDADGNVQTMDGVIVNPTATTTSSSTANNVLVLFARPGEVGWSPVVRLREFVAVGTAKPADYKSLCYDAPCASNAVDMTKATRYAGTLFLIGGAP